MIRYVPQPISLTAGSLRKDRIRVPFQVTVSANFSKDESKST
jgi:hypothetical protein